jgi:hypothetical protein
MFVALWKFLATLSTTLNNAVNVTVDLKEGTVVQYITNRDNCNVA